MAEIRYITVPGDIEVSIGEQKIPRTFEQFIKERTRDPGAFGGDLDGIMLGLGLRQSFLSCRSGEVIGVPLDQWTALCVATRTPRDGYNAELMYHLIPHARAILDAPSTKPCAAEPSSEPS